MRGNREYILVFDGSCGLCVQIVNWISRRGPKHPMRYVDYHDQRTLQDLPVSFEEADRSVILLTPRGRKLKGYAASLGVIRLLPGMKGRALILRLIWPLGSLGYQLVTRFRHTLSRILGLEPRWRLARGRRGFYHSSG